MKKLSRREFMKLFGASAAALLMTRCRAISTCYAPMPPPTETPFSTDPNMQRLYELWLQLSDLAGLTKSGSNEENATGEIMISTHRNALNALVASSGLSSEAAGLVQEAYAAAVYHIWRSNAPITCYEPVIVDYAPISAEILAKQAEELSEFASQGTVVPETLEKARAALEHDMAFYDLSDEQVNQLYERLMADHRDKGLPIPSFENLELEISPAAKEAADFILHLLAVR
jgi:hypothetical protein